MSGADPVAAQRLRRTGRRIQQQVDRRVRRVEQSTSGRRQVTVATRDPALLTCQVYLDGDTATPVPCGLAGGVVPVVGQGGWADQNGTDLLLLAMAAGVELPKVKLRSTATLTTGGSPIFPWGTGDVRFDTDLDENALTMFDDAADSVVARWPGVYAFGARGFVSGPAGAVAICRVQLNGVTYIDAWQDTIVNGDPQHWHMSSERRFVVGDSLRLEMSSTGGATTWGTNSNEIGVAMWLSYRP